MNFIEIGDDFKPFNFREEPFQVINKYDELEFGDIILAKRYQTEEEMQEIQKGHRVGPFVVIGKDKNGLQCLYGTGTPPKSQAFNYRTLELKDLGYSLDKISYIHVAIARHITESMFIKRIDHLMSQDKKRLLKKIEIVNREGLYVDMDINTVQLPLEAGDIINSWRNPYLIINETESAYECISMSDKSNGTNFFIGIDGIKYYFDFENPKTYSKLLEPVRNGFIDNNTLSNVLAMQQQRLNYLKTRYEASRGSIIKKDDLFYYIYGEKGNLWQAFLVSPIEIESLCCILVRNKPYYTDFKELIELPKKQFSLKVIDTAYDEEMDQIKEKKKSYQKSGKSLMSSTRKSQKQKRKNIDSGSIVKLLNTDSTNYQVVILRSQGDLVTMEYDKFLEGEYRLHKCSISDVDYIGEVENFDLPQVLSDIQEITEGFINKNRLTEIRNNLRNKKQDSAFSISEQKNLTLEKKTS